MDRPKILSTLRHLKIAIYGSNLRAFSVAQGLRELGLDFITVEASSEEVDLDQLDICILAGWSKLIRQDELAKPTLGFINCHAGKLPEYRGSSPLNWSLLNNEKKFGLSVIVPDENFDTGEILVSREFDILPEFDINDLHGIANMNFPDMIIEALVKKILGLTGYPQPNNCSRYYPLRSPEDGRINWHLDNALKISQKIKALSAPYPGCYCFMRTKKVLFSKLVSIETNFFGVAGKIYRAKQHQILVGTIDGAICVEYQVEDGLHLNAYEVFDT